MDEGKLVYWDIEKQMFYWIEWVRVGNHDEEVRHYIKRPIIPKEVK